MVRTTILALLLVQVENLEYTMRFRARLTDAQGHRLEGVETSISGRPPRRR